MEAIPGYLSLHQNADIMTLKWTPNQLMNGSVGDLDYERRCKTIQHIMNILTCKHSALFLYLFSLLFVQHSAVTEKCSVFVCGSGAADVMRLIFSTPAHQQPADGLLTETLSDISQTS